ncbi:TlyA family RNA methyltransferase [Stappia indica]|uniref:23S rRNA (Cytidine1920-2'-O)/16S rRNA (Cytidine1409-2'-O)-methyltransferase n=1 Tax=Stappia indica TaxID=538381 RepID=A0A285SP47_9HYPH|nr:TlyA family RNA methyltransferase [Stappia indica]SOC09965.1 23S rRNA (cytidine1920-2'-O)/16S rRNA (cytidine1409-2'-O)-methyltransferase [Stappia indica]
MAERERLDQLLVARGLVESRARARDAILRGHVRVDGMAVDKPGQKVGMAVRLDVDDPAGGYVSRAALKLKAGLEHFSLDVAGRIALDLGASTGGFTQVLLEAGAAKVHAIDVGHGQMHASIADDPRVIRRDGINARALTLEDLNGEHPAAVVSDMSFISLRLALPPALELAAPGACGLFLVKPQFEAGREAVGKGGLVDPQVGEEVARDLVRWLADFGGWSVLGLEPSPITGGDGNREWLLAAMKGR